MGTQPGPRILAVTGAGISAASGLATYRTDGQHWDDPELETLNSKTQWAKNRQKSWEHWNTLRTAVAQAQPNPGHYALAHQPAISAIITQNIDGLHQKAGSPNVIELHGNIATTRCSRPTCNAKTPSAATDGPDARCTHCGKHLRPDIVLFGERIPTTTRKKAEAALHNADILLYIGTSGNVWPVAGWPENFKGTTILLNPTQWDRQIFDIWIRGNAETHLQPLLDDLTRARRP